MVEIRYYDPAERQREKQLSREQDERDLREGRITARELSAINGVFSALDIANARIVRRGRVSV
jgi:hypothetical protein